MKTRPKSSWCTRNYDRRLDRQRAVLARDRDRRRGCDAARAPATSAHPWRASLQDVPGAARRTCGTRGSPRPQAPSIDEEPELLRCVRDVRAAHPGGAEVEISMLFADVRGSTTLAEHMRPTEFSSLMNRFFDRANRVVIDVRGEFSDEYFAQAATNRPVSGCRPRTTAPATTRCSPTGPGQSAAIAPTSPRWPRRQRAS